MRFGTRQLFAVTAGFYRRTMAVLHSMRRNVRLVEVKYLQLAMDFFNECDLLFYVD